MTLSDEALPGDHPLQQLREDLRCHLVRMQGTRHALGGVRLHGGVVTAIDMPKEFDSSFAYPLNQSSIGKRLPWRPRTQDQMHRETFHSSPAAAMGEGPHGVTGLPADVLLRSRQGIPGDSAEREFGDADAGIARGAARREIHRVDTGGSPHGRAEAPVEVVVEDTSDHGVPPRCVSLVQTVTRRTAPGGGHPATLPTLCPMGPCGGVAPHGPWPVSHLRSMRYRSRGAL
jgi:hypothetical protein